MSELSETSVSDWDILDFLFIAAQLIIKEGISTSNGGLIKRWI